MCEVFLNSYDHLLNYCKTTKNYFFKPLLLLKPPTSPVPRADDVANKINDRYPLLCHKLLKLTYILQGAAGMQKRVDIRAMDLQHAACMYVPDSFRDKSSNML